MKHRAMLIALTLLFATAAAHADTYTHKATGLQFTLPKGWKCTEEKGRILIQNGEKTVHVVGGAIGADDAKAVFADAKKFVSDLPGFSAVKVTEGPKKEKVNDLQQAWYAGSATVKEGDKEKQIEWDLIIVTGGKTPLFLLGVGQLDKNEKVYEKFFESIQKAKDDE